ncbi:MAG: DUF5131 family protein [Terriglobia bacterium]
MKDSKINWCNHTWNPVIGCTKVSPACDHCYAEALAKRWWKILWGPFMPRRRTSEATWRLVIRLDAEAEELGIRPRVFCASLADCFDHEWKAKDRDDMWRMIEVCRHLDFLMLTKRPQNFKRFLPWGKNDRPWSNVWLGVSTENIKEAQRRISILREYPAVVRWTSAEPLLEDLSSVDHTGLDWIIAGGESGSQSRPMLPPWVRSLKREARRAGAAFWVKQFGTLYAKDLIQIGGIDSDAHATEMKNWPADLRIRELPEPHKVEISRTIPAGLTKSKVA